MLRPDVLGFTPRRLCRVVFVFGKRVIGSCVYAAIPFDGFLWTLVHAGCRADSVYRGRIPAVGYCDYSRARGCGRQHRRA